MHFIACALAQILFLAAVCGACLLHPLLGVATIAVLGVLNWSTQ